MYVHNGFVLLLCLNDVTVRLGKRTNEPLLPRCSVTYVVPFDESRTHQNKMGPFL